MAWFRITNKSTSAGIGPFGVTKSHRSSSKGMSDNAQIILLTLFGFGCYMLWTEVIWPHWVLSIVALVGGFVLISLVLSIFTPTSPETRAKIDAAAKARAEKRAERQR